MNRVKILLAWIPALILSGALFAQQKATTKDNSLLWRVSGKHLAKPSFLFGTMHLICADDYVWTVKMKETLEKSEKVCFEMALDDPSIMMQVAAGMIDNSGKKLKDYFTPEQYETVSRFLKDTIGMDIALFEQMKPIMLESVISTNGGFNCDNPRSYEDSIMKTAKDAKKEILGLEDPKEQIETLETIPVDSVITELLEEIENRNANAKDSEYLNLIKAYKQQNLAELYTMLTTTKGLKDEMDKFLDARNKKWIPRMEDKMSHASVFFAVGAGHLWGPNGVISLLRKKGYTVEPYK